MRLAFYSIATLIASNSIAPAFALEVSIPDSGLNAAIRQALQKPIGPLTEQDLLGLTILDASSRNISSVEGLEVARNLVSLDLFQNQLTNFTLPNGFGNLVLLDLGFNSLSQCSIPDGLTNLDTLFLEGNLLTSFTLPAGLNALTTLDLSGNQLPNLTLPAGMTNLSLLILVGNQLTTLTLPPDLTKLERLTLSGNPLTTLVLSEPSADTRLAALVALLANEDVAVFTYPLAIGLLKPRQTLDNAFAFVLAGPPGIYAVLGSTDLVAWSALGAVTNTLGSIVFTDVAAHLSSQKFYIVHSVR